VQAAVARRSARWHSPREALVRVRVRLGVGVRVRVRIRAGLATWRWDAARRGEIVSEIVRGRARSREIMRRGAAHGLEHGRPQPRLVRVRVRVRASAGARARVSVRARLRVGARARARARV